MKRGVFLVIFTLFGFNFIFAAKPISGPFVEKELSKDRYYIRFAETGQDSVSVKKKETQNYKYAFSSKNSDYELRYIFFTQVKDFDSFKEYKESANLITLDTISKIIGEQADMSMITSYSDDDVKNEFKADILMIANVEGAKTDYIEDYEYIMISIFFKRGVGIVFQTIQYNDMNWLGTKYYQDSFYGFSFK